VHLSAWNSPHCSKEYRQIPIRSLSADTWTSCASRAGFAAAPGLRFDLAHIQLADVTAPLAVEQGLSKALYFVLALLEKAQTGADHFTRGPIASGGKLPIDEALEVLAETDAGGLGHAGPPMEYHFMVIIGNEPDPAIV